MSRLNKFSSWISRLLSFVSTDTANYVTLYAANPNPDFNFNQTLRLLACNCNNPDKITQLINSHNLDVLDIDDEETLYFKIPLPIPHHSTCRGLSSLEIAAGFNTNPEILKSLINESSNIHKTISLSLDTNNSKEEWQDPYVDLPYEYYEAGEADEDGVINNGHTVTSTEDLSPSPGWCESVLDYDECEQEERERWLDIEEMEKEYELRRLEDSWGDEEPIHNFSYKPLNRAIFLAARHNPNPIILEILISSGAELHPGLLRYAVQSNNFDVVTCLIKKGADVNAMAVDKRTVAPCVNRIGLGLDAHDYTGYLQYIQNVDGYDLIFDSVGWIIEENLWSPLMLAVTRGMYNSYYPKWRDLEDFYTPPVLFNHMPSKLDTRKIVDILLEHGANIREMDHEENSILNLALEYSDDTEIVSKILSEEPSLINHYGDKGLPYEQAASRGNEYIEALGPAGLIQRDELIKENKDEWDEQRAEIVRMEEEGEISAEEAETMRIGLEATVLKLKAQEEIPY